MDVDRNNFDQGLAALRAALAIGDYYALDCEFTGVENGGDKNNNKPPPPLRPDSCDAVSQPTTTDDPEERYPALRSAASRFAVAQVGIAVFEWRKEKRNGGRYFAHAFNFWTFCSNLPRSAFECTTGSLSFLSGAGFDFNRWIGSGIPSCSARERDDGIAREEARKAGFGGRGGGGGGGATANGDGGGFQRPPIVPSRPDDVALVAETVSRVREWLLLGEEEEEESADGAGGGALRLRGGNAFQRALVYQTLERGAELSPVRYHAGTTELRFVAKTLWPDEEEAFRGEQGKGEGEKEKKRPRHADIVLRRVPAGGARLAAEQESQKRIEAARKASGFALALEALRESALPCVAHNGAGDVAHVVAAFGDGVPLPSSFSAFRNESVARWFPGGVWDTKVLATRFLKGAFDSGSAASSLRDLYDGLVDDGGGGANERDDGGGETPTSHLPKVPLPCLTSSRYASALRSGGSSIDGLEHEAGFDALLTGSAMWGIATALRSQRKSEKGDGNVDDESESDDDDGQNGNGTTRARFPTFLPLPPFLQRRDKQQQQQKKGPSPRDLVASVEEAASDDGGGGGAGGGVNGSDDVVFPSSSNCRRVRFSKLPAEALGCVYAHMSDWGVLPLMTNEKNEKKKKNKSTSPTSMSSLFSLPPERRNVLYVVPLPVLLFEERDGGEREGGGGGGQGRERNDNGNNPFRALARLASTEAGAGRCRAVPRLRGWAASIELFEASASANSAPFALPRWGERPQQQQQRQQENGTEDGRPARHAAAVDPSRVAESLSRLPQLRGCRVMNYREYREWKLGAIEAAEVREGGEHVDEERAAAAAAAAERAAVIQSLPRKTATATRRRSGALLDEDVFSPQRKRARAEEEEGGGGRACTMM